MILVFAARDMAPYYRPDDAAALAAMGQAMDSDAMKAVQAAILALSTGEGQGR